MSELFSVRKRLIGLGLMGALVMALAVLGTLWGLSQTASADPGVSLVHVEPDGTDYEGNPDCPETVWDDGKVVSIDPRHDCNNLASQRHVIRTSGFDRAIASSWQFNKEGVGTVESQGGLSGVRCGDLTELTDRPGWNDQCADPTDDDGDTVVNDGCGQVGATAETATDCTDKDDDDGDTVINDGCPAVGVSEDLGDQQCLVIHSKDPGETRITFTYTYLLDGESALECAVGNITDDDGDTVVNDGCPQNDYDPTASEDGCGADTCSDSEDNGPLCNDNGTDGADENDSQCLVGGPETGLQCTGNTADEDQDQFVNDGCPAVGTAETACNDANDDDNDGYVNDGCPEFGTPETGLQCSGNTADEDGDTDVNDGCPAVFGPATATNTTIAVFKEWDKLEDTVILKAGDVDIVTVPGRGKVELPKDADGDGDRDAADEHDMDHNGNTQDHGVIWDESRKRLKSEVGPIRLIEVVHGQHGPAGTWEGDHPTEGAIILAFIDSERAPGCTYFTNTSAVRLWPGTAAERVFQTGELDLGTAVVGISDWRGFFVGPRIWPAGAQFNAEALAEATTHKLQEGLSSNSAVIPVDAFGFPVPGLTPVSALEFSYVGVYVDTECEEQATITFKVGYPDYVQSVPEIPEPEWVEINWTTVEAAKQPQIRWAGEEIVLEKRWGVSSDWYPEAGGIDNDADTKVNEDPPDDDGDTFVDEDPNECDDFGGPVDNDLDGFFNDGCPSVGAAETPAQCAAGDNQDQDQDGWVNDGCAEVGARGEDEIDTDNDGMEDGSGPMPFGGDCSDGIDNDGDTTTDEADSDCKKLIDEDTGGFADDDDKDAEEGLGSGRATCYDKIDNDGDCPGDTDGNTVVCDAGDVGVDKNDRDCHDPANAFIDEDGPDTCPLAGLFVKYSKLGGPGGLISGLPDVQPPPGNVTGMPDIVWTYIGADCVSKALYSSEEPGQVDVEATLYEGSCVRGGCSLVPFNKHAFLVWYLKIYQLKLTNVPGEREFHNDGKFKAADGADILDPSAGDVEEETLNVSQDALLRVRVKGWFYGGNNSSRGDVCVDMDGDGDGAGSEPGVPYPTTSHQGCVDTDDEMLPAGYWVLPDDIEALAGPHPDRIPSWDVMSEPDVSASSLIGPKSTLDSHDSVTRAVVPCIPAKGKATCTRKTIDPDGKITEADALMPPLKILVALEDDDAGFLKPVTSKSADLDIKSAYQSVMIPANPEIPPIVNNGGYDWDSWGWHALQRDYPFFIELTKTTKDGMTRAFEFYTDNRGEGFFFANGDYNLDYEDCAIQKLFGAPDCDDGDVVGTTDITVIGDYPYFRKHPAVESNPVTKTWTWGGLKKVTAVAIDDKHTAIIAHVKDRDGYCKYDVDVNSDIDVTFSPSLNPVEGEEITFILHSEGAIIDVSDYALFSVDPTPLGKASVTDAADGTILAGRKEAVGLAEDVRVLDGMETLGMVDVGSRTSIDDDECQAWIVIEHALGADLELSIYFDDPEGKVARDWPPSELTVNLIEGWNDACYAGPEGDVEDVLTDAGIVDAVDAVYLYDSEDDTWMGWFNGRPDVSDLSTLEPYDQLFVLASSNAGWVQEIQKMPTEASLAEGWDSVCYTGDDKSTEDATAGLGGLVIMYSLTSVWVPETEVWTSQWLRFAPGRPELTTLASLDRFDSVFTLVTTAGGATWIFNP